MPYEELQKKNIYLFRRFAMLLTAVLPMMGFTVSNGSDVGYSREFSELFAKTFLSNVTDSQIEITDVRDVYSFNETVYGSKVSFRNTQTEKDGYIIFSIDGHVNEYSLDGEPETLSDKDNKLYYNGDYTYFSKTKSGDYLDRFGEKVENFKNIAKNYFNKKLTEKLYFNKGKAIYGKDGIITDPESTFPDSLTVKSITSKNISNNDLYYVATYNYSGYTNHCGPTAIVNCMIYFDNNEFPDLLCGSSYKDNKYIEEFKEICEIADFKNDGLSTPKEAKTMLEFAERRYPGQFKKHEDYYITHSDIEARTNENTPFIYGVFGHSRYEDHSLVGLGYKKFKCTFKGFLGITYSETNMFILVADGWANGLPVRYVNFDDASRREMDWITCV